MNKDLTVGKPSTVLRKFCLPLFLSVVFQQLYNIADSFVAGKFISENALAAVGNSYEITLIFLAFSVGCNIGCSVTVSHLFGAKRYSDLKTAVCTALVSCGVLCAVLMTLGLSFAKPLLKVIETPELIFDDSLSYLRIYILGLPFVIFYNVATGIFSALGDSKTPFYFLMCSSLSNIGMDILFVTALGFLFDRGVDGVAWATFICQGISCVLALIVVSKRLGAIPNEGKFRFFSWKMLGNIATVAIPSMLQQLFVSIGNICIQKLINSYGPGVIAGYSAAIKLNNLAISSFVAVSNGISNFSAQNIGAKKYERMKAGARAGILMIWILAVPFVLFYVFGGNLLVRFFVDEPTADALKAGRGFLMIVPPFYFMIAIKFVLDGMLRGARMMKQFMTSTFADLLLRVVLAWVLSPKFGTTGIWWSWPIGWLLAALLSVLFYKTARFDRSRIAEME